MISTFEPEYLFGDSLEDSKFDEISEYLQSHFQNKNAGNAMAKGNIPMHALVFCCGWETKSLRNIFSSIVTSMSNNMIYGKTLVQWFFKVSIEIYGGDPPTLDNIEIEPEKVRLFFNYLFVQKTGIMGNKKFRRIIDASVMTFH